MVVLLFDSAGIGKAMTPYLDYIKMRNLLTESLAISTTSRYVNSDGTTSAIPHDFVYAGVYLGDGKSRNYTIYRNCFINKTDSIHSYSTYHSIRGHNYDEKADHWNRKGISKTIYYKDDASFEKAILAIQKRLKG
jgi:hypothetical protein